MPPAIDAGQALTMDSVIPAPLCATYKTCAHATPVGSSSNQLLLISASTVVPLLVAGPSFLPRMQGTNKDAPRCTYDTLLRWARGAVAPPAPYDAMQSAAFEGSPRLMLVHLWSLQLGQCICLATCLGLCKLSLKSLSGSTRT